jgi:hypothetical protein
MVPSARPRLAGALHHPGEQQDPERRGEPGHGGRAAEHGRAQQEDSPAAEQVTQPATQHQQAGQRQQARVEHPLGQARADAERTHDVGQVQGHRGLVDQDHRVGQRHADQHQAQ